jgi:hypothetical protein
MKTPSLEEVEALSRSKSPIVRLLAWLVYQELKRKYRRCVYINSRKYVWALPSIAAEDVRALSKTTGKVTYATTAGTWRKLEKKIRMREGVDYHFEVN